MMPRPTNAPAIIELTKKPPGLRFRNAALATAVLASTSTVSRYIAATPSAGTLVVAAQGPCQLRLGDSRAIRASCPRKLPLSAACCSKIVHGSKCIKTKQDAGFVAFHFARRYVGGWADRKM